MTQAAFAALALSFATRTRLRALTRSALIEGSLETKVPTIWADEKHSQEDAEPGRNSYVEKVRREETRDGKVRREKMQVREKVRKSRNTVFPVFCGSGGSKSRLAKAAGAETSGQMRQEKLHPVVSRSTF